MDKKLTDEQLLDLLGDFMNLSEDERKQRFIGEGSNKSVYKLDDDHVIKTPHKGKSDSLNNHYKESMVKDYTGSKLLQKQGIDVEQPILIKHPDYGTNLVQKKLTPDSSVYDNIVSKVKEVGITPMSLDLNPDGVGVDNLGNAKVFDVGSFPAKVGETLDNSPRYKALLQAAKKLALSNFANPKIYRSMVGAVPLIGAGLTAATMSDDASASDFIPGLDQTESAGSAMDDKMMQTEVKARQNYEQSGAHKARLNALKGFGK